LTPKSFVLSFASRTEKVETVIVCGLQATEITVFPGQPGGAAITIRKVVIARWKLCTNPTIVAIVNSGIIL
jgi:hypothetical protein